MLPENKELWLRLYDLRTEIAQLRRMRMVSHVAREELHADIFFAYLEPPANDFFTRLLAALAELGATPYDADTTADRDKQVAARMAAALEQIDQLYADVYSTAVRRDDGDLVVVRAWIAETQRAFRRLSADMRGALLWTTVVAAVVK